MSHDVPAWYQGRRVLVLGGLGYIGAHVTRALIGNGARVTAVTMDRARHGALAGEFETSGVTVIEGDIRSSRTMLEAVQDQAVIFSLAGRSGAVQSVDDPAGDLDVNCRGNLVVLEAVRRQNPAAKFVFAGSRLAYGAVSTIPVNEDHPLAPLCPHGLHKAAVERYLAIYGRLHGLRATALRITNPYGSGQPAGRSAYGVINYLIHLALAGRPLPVYGDGSQQRDYIFIGDLVHALLAVGAGERSDGRVYNVGSGTGTRLIDAARLIVELVGTGHIESRPWPETARQIETGDFVADIERIHREVGWQPTVALVDGLRQTIRSQMAVARSVSEKRRHAPSRPASPAKRQ